MPPKAKPIDERRLLALRATGMGVARLCKTFRIGPVRVREILAEYEIGPEKAHYPGQDGIMRPSGRLLPCQVCGKRSHPQEMKCRMCGIVCHPEWEKPGSWWVEKRCHGCTARDGVELIGKETVGGANGISA